MVHRDAWYTKVLTKKKSEILASAAFAAVFALAILLWHFALGKSFEWNSISPVSAPGLLPRLFYSALVYVTLGALVFATGFYKFLYSLYRGTQGGWRKYKEAKRTIWGLFMLLMYFVIVPFVVKILNAVISFFYNIFNLLLYLVPPLGISAIVFIIGYFFYKKYRGQI
jgi:hypothetical protein